MMTTHARRLRSCFFSLMGAAAVAVVPSSVLAAAGQHTTLLSFQQNVRADVLLEPFNGPTGLTPAIAVSGNGYSYSAASAGDTFIYRQTAFGVGAGSDIQATRFTFTGKPVTAFGGTFRRLDPNLNSVGGTISVQTDTGESFSVSAAVGGTFFGFTTTQPFSTVTLDTTGNGRFEYVDDLYVGTSGTAAVVSDQCADAVTISPLTAVQYPFTTVGATATAIQGVCDSAIDTGPDVWFRFVPSVYANVTVSTCGSDFDSILRVFGTCPNAFGDGQIACNDDFCTGGGVGFSRASLVQFRVEAGEDYYIRISGFNGAAGSGNLTFSVVPDCRGDSNHSGALEVADIFDFLNKWFAGCP